MEKLPPQIVGNCGLFAVAHELSKRGWNVLITSRNAAGPDILAYDSKRRAITVQVKGTSKNGPRDGFGVRTSTKDKPVTETEIEAKVRANTCDYWVFVRDAISDNPQFYVMTPEDVIAGCNKHGWAAPRPEQLSRWGILEEADPLPEAETVE